MSLAGTIKQTIATAHGVVSSLEETVKHEAWIGQDGMGSAQYGAPVNRLALVEQALQSRRLADGRIVEVQAKLTILEEVAANGAADRTEPVDPRDRFTLADGSTGPVLDVKGLRNPESATPFLLEIYLGVER